MYNMWSSDKLQSEEEKKHRHANNQTENQVNENTPTWPWCT